MSNEELKKIIKFEQIVNMISTRLETSSRTDNERYKEINSIEYDIHFKPDIFKEYHDGYSPIEINSENLISFKKDICGIFNGVFDFCRVITANGASIKFSDDGSYMVDGVLPIYLEFRSYIENSGCHCAHFMTLKYDNLYAKWKVQKSKIYSEL
jgi:hypothetical protein